MTTRPWDFSLRQLRTFIAVVEQGNISTAARALHVTQPAVSKMIRGIEQVLGTALFLRRGRDITLTPVGEMFLRHARAAIAEFKAGALEYEALREDKTELVRVFGAPSVMPVLVPRAIARLRQTRPNIQVILSAEAYYGTAGILTAVANGDVDLGITLFQEEPATSELSARRLFDARLWAMARKDHPLAARAEVKMVDLVHELVVLPPLESIAGRIMAQEFSAVGLPFPPQRIVAANRQVTMGLVRECNAIAFMISHPACGDLDADEFIHLPIRFRQPLPWQISLCQRANSIPSPALSEFTRCLEILVAEAERAEAEEASFPSRSIQDPPAVKHPL